MAGECMLHCFLLPAGQEEGQEALEALPVAAVLFLVGSCCARVFLSCRTEPNSQSLLPAEHSEP